MFAPTFQTTRQVPGWMSTTPQLMVLELYSRMAEKPEFTLTNHAGTKLDAAAAQGDKRYNYAALTSSQPSVSDGDFAFNTTVNLSTSRVTRQTHQQQFLEVTLTSHIFTGSRYEMLGDVTHSVRIPIGGMSISRTISALTAPKRSEIHAALFQLVGTHATVLSEKMLCSPLSATMAARKNGMHVTIGARQGLGVNHLAVVSGNMTPWTILRVTEVNPNGATLMPLNRQRKLAELDGQQVTFLEFN
jgi:hypothetical protein